jgi:hypothetical protein
MSGKFYYVTQLVPRSIGGVDIMKQYDDELDYSMQKM